MSTPLGFDLLSDSDSADIPSVVNPIVGQIDTYLQGWRWRGRRHLTAFAVPDDNAYHDCPMDTLDSISSSTATLGTSGSPNYGLCVVPAAGYYMVAGTATFAANASGQRGAVVAVNGSRVDGDFEVWNAAASGPTRIPEATDIVYCVAGDVISLQLFQNSGGTLNTEIIVATRLLVCRYLG